MSRTQRTQSRRIPIFGIVVAGVALLGVLAVVLVAASDSGDGDGEVVTSGPQTAAVEVDGSPLPPYTGGTDAAIGTPAPSLSGVDFSQSPVAVEPNGRPTAIAFLAHWCPHCQREVPRLAAFVNGPGVPDGVDLVIVPTSTNPNENNYPPEPWLTDAGLGDVPTLVDSEGSTAFTTMGGTSFPFFVFLDADHDVAGRLVGELPDGAFDTIFAALAAGQEITPDLLTGSGA